MLYPGIDDDQIIRFHIVQGTFNIKLAPAADAVKHLAAGMGMGHRMPVAAKTAFADIKQAYRFPRGDFHIQIIAGIHLVILLAVQNS